MKQERLLTWKWKWKVFWGRWKRKKVRQRIDGKTTVGEIQENVNVLQENEKEMKEEGRHGTSDEAFDMAKKYQN